MLLAGLLRGLLWGGVLAALWVGWQFLRGPREVPAPPSVRVARLVPGSFTIVNAPVSPPGAQPGARDPLKLLVLREPGGLVRGYFLPHEQGRVTVPVSGALVSGAPCEDFSPDFATQDIGCRQARPGFDFALRHRWALDGHALTPGTPPLLAAQGREVDGDWLLELAEPRRP